VPQDPEAVFNQPENDSVRGALGETRYRDLGEPNTVPPSATTEFTPVPEDQYSTGPEDQYSTLPEHQYSTLPEGQYSTVPEDQYSTLPEDQYSTFPEDGAASSTIVDVLPTQGKTVKRLGEQSSAPKTVGDYINHFGPPSQTESPAEGEPQTLPYRFE
jgi:hypothetical protein